MRRRVVNIEALHGIDHQDQTHQAGGHRGGAGFDVKAFFALFTARGVAVDVVDSLNRSLNKVINHAEVRKRFATLGIDAAGSSVEALTALIYLESRKWGPIVQRTGASWD